MKSSRLARASSTGLSATAYDWSKISTGLIRATRWTAANTRDFTTLENE